MDTASPSLSIASPQRIGYADPMAAHFPEQLRKWPAGAALLVLAIALLLAVGRGIAAQPFAIDRTILAAMRGIGPHGLRAMAIDLTALGGGTVLTLIVLAVATMLVVRRQLPVAAMLVGASWSGGRVVQLAKDAVGRARPDLADRLVSVTSASFPSAHAANAATVYLILAALVARQFGDQAVRRSLFAAAILLVGAIGASRVYLGVHWPSDVLAGWSFGALWAAGWWRIAADLTRPPAPAAPPPA